MQNYKAPQQRLVLIVLGLVLGITCYAEARERHLVDFDWRFTQGDVTDASSSGFNDQSWRQVNLPHDWSIEGIRDKEAPSGNDGGYFPTGIGWYRKVLEVPESWQGQQVHIHFEGVYQHATVWINGHRLGKHPYGYTPFEYNLTPHLHFGQHNVIAVKVDNSDQPNCRWYSGSGIYRHVWLRVVEPVSIDAKGIFISTANLQKQQAVLNCQVAIRNDTDKDQHVAVTTRFYDPDDTEVAISRSSLKVAAQTVPRLQFRTHLPDPQAWSPDSPQLYRAETSVEVDEEQVDKVTTNFGVRTVTVSAERGLELNGKPVELIGANVHHDNGPLGARAFDRAEQRRVQILKDAGFNAIRTAHNPPSTAFLNACDRKGMLVIDECFDGWAQEKLPHDYSTVFHQEWRNDLTAMIERDRNHPSVIIWSIGNEVFERGKPSGVELTHKLTRLVRQKDSNRPVTIGLNGLGSEEGWLKLDAMFEPLDVAGYNYEAERVAEDHKRVPSRVIFYSESFLRETFRNWQLSQEYSYVIGDFVWTGMDYLGESGIGQHFAPGEEVRRHWEGVHFPWHGAYCGDIDITGWRKPVSHYRNIVWDRGEQLYVGVVQPTSSGKPWGLSKWSLPPKFPSWSWPGEEGKPLQVEVYSRYPRVRLILNDRVVGEKSTTESEEFRATFSVPYEPGNLQVVALEDGKIVDESGLATASKPAQIDLRADRQEIVADGQDLAFVTVEVHDKQGRLQPHPALPIHYSLKGPGEIIGIGSAEMTSLQSYQANPRDTFHGRSLVIIRASQSGGEIQLSADSPSLEPATVTLQASGK